jgi:LytS/YehU family sensor histidine kinase
MAVLFAVFKMFRKYYLKMEETQMLERENIEAEAKWLKAQVHPHFLFNTLNNIYSSILIRSPKAADLLDNLSNLLRYMIHENDEQFVPLEKEIQLLNNYIGLQKVRYDERLQIDMEVKGEYEHEMVAPFLMIPFLENAFKHGVSKLNAQKWIRILVRAESDRLFFSISNSKPASLNAPNKTTGIGLDNVRKRLEYIYHGEYDFGITETENVFAVNLNVPLLKQKNYNSFQFKPQKISGYA